MTRQGEGPDPGRWDDPTEGPGPPEWAPERVGSQRRPAKRTKGGVPRRLGPGRPTAPSPPSPLGRRGRPKTQLPIGHRRDGDRCCKGRPRKASRQSHALAGASRGDACRPKEADLVERACAWPVPGRLWTNTGPASAEPAQHWPFSGQTMPVKDKIGHSSNTFGRVGPIGRRTWPMFGQACGSKPNSSRQLHSLDRWPSRLVAPSPDVGRNSPGLGCTQTKCCRFEATHRRASTQILRTECLRQRRRGR